MKQQGILLASFAAGIPERSERKKILSKKKERKLKEIYRWHFFLKIRSFGSPVKIKLLSYLVICLRIRNVLGSSLECYYLRFSAFVTVKINNLKDTLTYTVKEVKFLPEIGA